MLIGDKHLLDTHDFREKWSDDRVDGIVAVDPSPNGYQYAYLSKGQFEHDEVAFDLMLSR